VLWSEEKTPKRTLVARAAAFCSLLSLLAGHLVLVRQPAHKKTKNHQLRVFFLFSRLALTTPHASRQHNVSAARMLVTEMLPKEQHLLLKRQVVYEAFSYWCMRPSATSV
jgi:hypothetical protein